jgi:hypothetical protein
MYRRALMRESGDFAPSVTQKSRLTGIREPLVRGSSQGKKPPKRRFFTRSRDKLLVAGCRPVWKYFQNLFKKLFFIEFAGLY